MSLAHAILGLLTYEPRTGYDLKAFFDNSINFFWPAQLSQIYRDLGTLEGKGCVTYHIEPQEGRPDRKVYNITDEGRRVFSKWLEKFPSTLSSACRDEFSVRMFFGSQLSNRELVFQLTRFVREKQDELDSLTRITRIVEMYSQKNPPDKIYWQMLLRRQELTILALIQWAEEAIHLLESSGSV
ncbi:MAG: PadR family transcriptional regulator [Methylocystaceae bacterium]